MTTGRINQIRPPPTVLHTPVARCSRRRTRPGLATSTPPVTVPASPALLRLEHPWLPGTDPRLSGTRDALTLTRSVGRPLSKESGREKVWWTSPARGGLSSTTSEGFARRTSISAWPCRAREHDSSSAAGRGPANGPRSPHACSFRGAGRSLPTDRRAPSRDNFDQAVNVFCGENVADTAPMKTSSASRYPRTTSRPLSSRRPSVVPTYHPL